MAVALDIVRLDQKRLSSRVRGRQTARELCGLLKQIELSDRDFMAACLEQLLTEAKLDLALIPASQLQAAHVPEPLGRLATWQIPFGKYQGCSLDEIPLDYLDWLCRSQEDFYKGLRAYLQHPDLRSRRGAELGHSEVEEEEDGVC